MSLFLLAAGLLLLIVVLAFLHWFSRTAPADLARAMRTFVATIAALAGTGLVLTGRWGLAMIALMAMIAALRSLRQSAPASPFGEPDEGGRTSSVATDTLEMTLDHHTGELDGTVTGGPHAGRSLASLGLSDLLQLLLHCRIEDPSSVALLETYLDRRFPDWRERSFGDDDFAHGRGGGGGGEPAMDEARACDILGLRPGASEEEIKAAHRRLMTRLHPDHGGSNYLAAEINRAKDYLLGRRA